MIDTPEVTTTAERLTAVIRLTVPRAEIGAVMGPAIGEVRAAVEAQGIGPTGPVFSYHLRMDPAVFDFEVGMPVSAPVTPVGRVVASSLPSVRAARTVYRGPYEGLGPAWGEFERWVKAEGLVTTGVLWEYYAKGPEAGPDASKWETELVQPLR
jgi:effector-binding domain-containing protein